jgi:hypothetical protein
MHYIPGVTKVETIQVRLTPSEKESFVLAADLAGIPLSSWVRERLRRVCIRELEEAAMPIPFLRNLSLD